MVFLDSVSYKNTTIADFAGNSCPKELLKLVRRMQREGFGPMEYTNVRALNASAQLLDLRRGKKFMGMCLFGMLLTYACQIW